MLDAGDYKRLIGILSRLGSSFDGERAVAALLADRFLRDRNLRWEGLIPFVAPEIEQEETYALDLKVCRKHIDALTSWEQSFISSMLRWRGPPSAGQSEMLASLVVKLNNLGLN